MTLSITLSPAAEESLRAKAAARGEELDRYASEILERAAAARSLDEVLAPFRRQVADSGLTDQALDEFFEDVRERAFKDRMSS